MFWPWSSRAVHHAAPGFFSVSVFSEAERGGWTKHLGGDYSTAPIIHHAQLVLGIHNVMIIWSCMQMKAQWGDCRQETSTCPTTQVAPNYRSAVRLQPAVALKRNTKLNTVCAATLDDQEQYLHVILFLCDVSCICYGFRSSSSNPCWSGVPSIPFI